MSPVQFEDSMVEICMKLLDLSHKHKEDPVADVAARCDPIYVSRVVSAMVGQTLCFQNLLLAAKSIGVDIYRKTYLT